MYQSLNRIFDATSQWSLKRTSKVRLEIRNLARKRFVLGYPPRKQGDTSIDDAINWEWIVRCAEASQDNHNVLLVSRDGDFGVSFGKDAILNDWLRREFKERVSRKRKIELTTKLTVALRKLDEYVTAEDETEEEKLIKEESEQPYSDFYELIGALVESGAQSEHGPVWAKELTSLQRKRKSAGPNSD